MRNYSLDHIINACMHAIHSIYRDVHPVIRMLPPEYDSSYLQKESPPVYRDALQDRVLVSGTFIRKSKPL